MGFKLVRVDATEPYKVILPLGLHYVGRGKFLNCNDNRVSRNHAELTVTSNYILLKSLHLNPCFLKKNSSTDTIKFSQPDSQVLSNGDQFGLTPDSYWYEVIHCTEDSPTEPTESKDVTNENPTNTDKNSNTQYYSQEEESACSESILDAIVNLPSYISQENNVLPAKEPENGSEEPPTDNPEDMDTTSTEQQVETTNQPDTPTNQLVESTSEPVEATIQTVESTDRPTEATTVTPTKRVHSEENSPHDVKRVKIEPEESQKNNCNDDAKTQPYAAEASASNQAVKLEPGSPHDVKPGPSNDRGVSSNDANGNPPAMPQSPTKPPNSQLRERCMYGANCYRRNPQHKAQFSHPTDSDWGSGARGVCPWGAACLKVDPRHWRDHDHPPGVAPPPPRPQGNRPGIQLVRRHGNNFYINANSVHFYDDHFELEDSDGDSVDYDYEF